MKHVDPIYDNLMKAIRQRNVTEVGVLLEKWPDDVNDRMFDCAISANAPEIVALLATRTGGDHMEGITYSASLGYLECVKVLTPHCSDRERKSALSTAVAGGHMDVVKYLVGQCDVKSSYALFNAILCEKHEIFEFLFPLSDPWGLLDKTRKHFQEGPPDDHERKCIAWFEQRMAEEQRKTLLSEISDTAVVRVSKL